MPLYAYTCDQCEHDFEALVFAGDDAVECPDCASPRVQRQLSVPAKPRSDGGLLPMACNPTGPSCGAPWCRKGK